MSGTVKRRHAKRRKAFYRGAAQRTDRRSEARKRFYANQLAKADRDLAAIHCQASLCVNERSGEI
jgi:hypothetical protein